MSLLNDMLKDLDKHRKGKNLSLYATRFSPKISPILPNISPWVIFPVVLSFIFLMGVFFGFKPSPPAPLPQAGEGSLAVSAIMTSQVASIPEPVLISQMVAIPQFTKESTSAFETSTVTKIFSELSEKEWQDEQLNLALDSIKEGKDFEAFNILTNLIEKFPEFSQARESLVSMYLNQKDYANAEQILAEGLTIAPRNLDLNMQKAQMLFEQEQNEAALAVLKSFHPNIRTSPDFYGLKAAILEALGHSKEASILYQFLIKIEPTNGKYWFGYALGLENKHAFIQAIAAYKQALESVDLDPEIQNYAMEKIKTLQG